jgi:hypothetical protein
MRMDTPRPYSTPGFYTGPDGQAALLINHQSSLVTPEYPKKQTISTPDVVDDALAATDLAQHHRSLQNASEASSGSLAPPRNAIKAMLAPRPGESSICLSRTVVLTLENTLFAQLLFLFLITAHAAAIPKGLPPPIPLITSQKSKSICRPNSGGPRLNKFVRRLHDMILAEKDSGIVEWRRGLLVLFSTDIFAKKLLPKYFATKNFKTCTFFFVCNQHSSSTC